jgi:putative nucleotidyltransferase with HDIG domain
MGTIDSGNFSASGRNSLTFWGRLREMFMNWLGNQVAPEQPRAATTDHTDSDESASEPPAEAQYVMAPGGYQIRVPNSNDTDRNIRDMLPSVRDSLDQLPPLPYVVTELLREIHSAQSSASSLAKIASSDPSLAASLLRTVNSAAIGLSRKITSVSEAVSYLGFATVKSIVVRLRLRDVLKPQSAQARQDAQDIWVHLLAVSYAAECLAPMAGVDRGFVSTLGLLHDIGKLAVIAKLPAQAEDLRKASADDPSEDSLAAERRILGVDHAHLGGELAATWKLPADLVQAIHWHHQPLTGFHVSDPLPLRKAVHVLQIANQLAKFCYPYCDQMQIEDLPKETFELVGLDGSIHKLLDAGMKKAISRAIFFADSNNDQQKAGVPRRFLRPLTGDRAAACLNAAAETSSLVVADDEAIDGAFHGSPSEVTQVSVPKLIRDDHPLHMLCHSWEANVEKCVAAARKYLTAASVSEESRSAAVITLGALLPNLAALCTEQETIEVSLRLTPGISIALRTPALAATRRAGKEASAAAALRLAQADLVHALNMDWFEKVTISSTGDALICVIK